jgi:hypothetical protein
MFLSVTRKGAIQKTEEANKWQFASKLLKK